MTDNNLPKQMGLKQAFAIAVGVPVVAVSAFAAFWPASLAVGCIAVGLTALPLTYDIAKHGKDNILTKSWCEYKEACSVVRDGVKSRLGL